MNTFSQIFKLPKISLIFIISMTLVIGSSLVRSQPPKSAKEIIIKGNNYGSLYNQGKLRTYYLYIPKSYNAQRSIPLLLVFHGDDSNGKSISQVTRFNQLAEQKGFIVVYPDALNQKWSLKANSRGKVDDVLFISSLIQHLQQQLNIDSKKIYATGFSRGGILTQALACKLSNKIAGFASVAGSLPIRLKPNCQPQNSISMLMINGTNDRDVLYEGDDHTQRGALMSISDMVDFWRSHDQCTSLLLSPEFSPDKIETSLYIDCINNSEVWQLAVVNGGHFWPGGTSTDDNLNKFNAKLGLNASKTIWDFFQRHSLSEVNDTGEITKSNTHEP